MKRCVNGLTRFLIAGVAFVLTAATVSAQLAPTISSTPTGYRPGDNITINFAFGYTGSDVDTNFSGAAMELNVPTGWTIDTTQSSLAGVPVKAFVAATGKLSFGCIPTPGQEKPYIQPSPTAAIPIVAHVPADFTGTATITATCAWTNVTKVSPTPLQIEETQNVTVTFTAATGGTIEGDTEQTGEIGFNCSQVTAVPTTNWTFVKWTRDGADYSTENPLNVTNVQNNMNLIAVFTTNFTLTFTAGAGGTLTGSASQTVAYGGDATPVTAVPNAGMEFVNWTGSATTTANPLTITNVQANHNYTANFQPQDGKCFVTIVVEEESAWGTVTGIVAGANNINEAIAITATPTIGYKFVNWSADPANLATFGSATSAATTVTFTGNRQNISLIATFVLDMTPIDAEKIDITLDRNNKNEAKDSVSIKNGEFAEDAYVAGDTPKIDIDNYSLTFVGTPKLNKDNTVATYKLDNPKATLTLRFLSGKKGGTWDLRIQKFKMWDKITDVNAGVTIKLTVNGVSYGDTFKMYYVNKVKNPTPKIDITLNYNSKNETKDSVSIKKAAFSGTAYVAGDKPTVAIDDYSLTFNVTPKLNKDNTIATYKLDNPKATLTLRFLSGSGKDRGTWDLSIQKFKMWDKFTDVNAGMTITLTAAGVIDETFYAIVYYQNKLKYAAPK